MGLGQSCMVGHILEGLCCSCDCSSNNVYTPDKLVLADAWYGVGLPGFIFPELRNTDDGLPSLLQKDDLAICLSGGGMRAAIASYGYVRGLYMLGVLKRARYLNGNSGSAWFTGPFCYQEEVSTEAFLGEYIGPEDLTLDRAGELTEGSFGKVCADANHLVGILLRKLGETNLMLQPCMDEQRQAKYRMWEDALGDMLLKPYNLNEADSTFCLAGREANAEAADVPFIYSACGDDSMPFPVITACVIAPERLPKATPFVSFEYTPLYSGVPTRVEDTDVKLGGVLVENFAACSLPPEEDVESGKHQVELDVRWATPLAQAMGDSSQFLAMAMNAHANLQWDMMSCPQTYLWNGIDHGGARMQMTDGGGSDNLAVYPALRRGVKKLIICSALAVPISPTWAKDEYDISGYFGAYPDGESFAYAKLPVTNDVWNRTTQVFERSRWDELLGKLTELKDKGLPQIIPMRLKVLPNKEQSILGGFEVDTVWIFNARPNDWWNQLPEETQSWINETVEGFPIVGTFIVDYDPETVSVLSNVCTWQVLQAHKELAALLA